MKKIPAKEKSIKNQNKIWIIIYAAAFIFSWIIFDYFFYPWHIWVVDSSVKVSMDSGFDLTPGELRFGHIRPSQSSVRKLIVRNPFSYPVKIRIEVEGNISSGLNVNYNNFELLPREEKQIDFTVNADDYPGLGDYGGKVRILYFRKFF